MKRKILSVCLIFILIISLVGCTMEKPEVVSSKDLQPLTIGVMPDLDSIPFIIAQHNGYFQKEGINVTIQHFKSAVDRDTALQTGNIDGAISDMLAVVFLKDHGFDVRITSKTEGSFKFIAGKDSNISSVNGISGKSIGISSNTIIEYLTDIIIKNANKDIGSIEKVAIPKIPTRLEMLQNGKLDMATLPEPLASVAIKNGGKVISSSDELGLNPGIMLFTKDVLNNKSEEIKALYRAYNEAVNYLNEESKESYIDILITAAGFPESIKDTLVLPNYSKASMASESELKEVLNWLQSKNLTKSNYSLEDLSDKSFIQ